MAKHIHLMLIRQSAPFVDYTIRKPHKTEYTLKYIGYLHFDFLSVIFYDFMIFRSNRILFDAKCFILFSFCLRFNGCIAIF